MKIAILEDDAVQAAFISDILKRAGHNPTVMGLGKTLVARLRQETFDLLLLDWNLPDMSAIEVMDWMRKGVDSPPPALIITSRTEIADAVLALDAGADDFLVKPVDDLLLLARINAVLRRAYPQERPSTVVTLADAVFDTTADTVHIHGQTVNLTSKEFELALALFRNLHRPLSRTYLLESVWGRNPDVPTRTLDAHVSRIRVKLGLRVEKGYRLAPVYSYGYRLEQVLDRGHSEDV